MQKTSKQSLIYYDQECRLCHGAVRFITQRDSNQRFIFRPLQSDDGAKLLAQTGLDPHQPGSLILVEGDHLRIRSDAALRIAGHLRAPWPLLRVFRIVPRPLRDAIYNRIARNRYRWFGQHPNVARR